MKPIDVTSDSYAEYNADYHKKEPKSKVDAHVRISDTKTFLLKDTIKTGQKKFLSVLKLTVKNTLLVTTLMVNLLLEVFMKKNCKKLDKKNLEVENAIKRKGDKLCIKWKGYDKSFNSWINKKDLE